MNTKQTTKNTDGKQDESIPSKQQDAFRYLKEFPLVIKPFDVILVKIPAKNNVSANTRLTITKAELDKINEDREKAETVPMIVAKVGSEIKAARDIDRGDIVYITHASEGAKIIIREGENFWENANVFMGESIIAPIQRNSNLYLYWLDTFNQGVEKILSILENSEKSEKLIGVGDSQEFIQKIRNRDIGVTTPKR